MRQQDLLSDSEKKLLNAIGTYPELSLKELLSHTQYKRTGFVAKKIKQLKEQNLLWGPAHVFDHGKLCKNPFTSLFCTVELGQKYETVVEYLRLIEPLVALYPVLSPGRGLLCLIFFSSNDREVGALLQLLKDNAIITDYTVRVRRSWTVYDNPNFFGDPNPPLDMLLEPCEFPEISLGHHSTEWNECDIATLSYLHGGYEGLGLIDVIKKESKVHKRKWTYEQVRHSHRKMLENKLIRKIYYVHPFPLEQCADFYLFIRTKDAEVTQRILFNFARGGRIHREYTLYDGWGLMGCIAHPQFVFDLMHNLDRMDEIEEKELYHLRSFPPGIVYVGDHSEFRYFDVETQTLEYPYQVFREKIKEKLEREVG